jgi:hypothetical protein
VHCQHHYSNTKVNRKEEEEGKLTQMTKSQAKAKHVIQSEQSLASKEMGNDSTRPREKMTSPQEAERGSTPLAKCQKLIGA